MKMLSTFAAAAALCRAAAVRPDSGNAHTVAVAKFGDLAEPERAIAQSTKLSESLAASGIVDDSSQQSGNAAQRMDEDKAVPTRPAATELLEIREAEQAHVSADPDMAPFMYPTERALLSRLMKESKTYFEFGSGGSTAWAVQTAGLQKIHTVENDLDWVAKLRKREDVQLAERDGRISFSKVDLGPVKEWANPVNEDEASQRQWGTYSDQILSDTEAHWDLVLIDGRFRVACALKALMHIKDPATTKLVMHDYEREHYHHVEDFADVVERVDRLVVLRKKADVDEGALKEVARSMERTMGFMHR